MAENVYKVVELVGTSQESSEKSAAAAVTKAAKSLRRSPHRRGQGTRHADRPGQGRHVSGQW
jgi:flavin-binding protein dodecin